MQTMFIHVTKCICMENHYSQIVALLIILNSTSHLLCLNFPMIDRLAHFKNKQTNSRPLYFFHIGHQRPLTTGCNFPIHNMVDSNYQWKFNQEFRGRFTLLVNMSQDSSVQHRFKSAVPFVSMVEQLESRRTISLNLGFQPFMQLTRLIVLSLVFTGSKLNLLQVLTILELLSK